jgi:AraC-like DNA-binding protein
MRSVDARPAAPRWDIATPARPCRVPGVGLAGFRSHGDGPDELSVVPYPAVTLAVDLGDRPLTVGDLTGCRESGSVAVGLAAEGVHGRGRAIECLQVRLSPVVAHAVLGGAVAELGVARLDELWGRDGGRLEERLRAVGSWPDRFALVEDALLRRSAAGRRMDPEVRYSWARLVASRGSARVAPLADEVGWSRKRLWSRFRAQTGLTPKRAAQLVRFDQAAHRLAAGRSASAVAAELGFADQSHLHRDVVAFAGATPTAVADAPWLAVDEVAWSAPAYLARH